MEIKVLAEEDLTKKVAVVMGTRPGIIKMAPLVKELTKRQIENFIIHTRQHYSENMELQFFRELELPNPLGVNQNMESYKTHAEQTAEMMRGVERILLEKRPRVVLVCGDANTNLAAGIAARKLGIVVGHVESGLRSHDWSMPEEHNRIMLDHICELLFAPTEDACQNLIKDNVRGQIYLTGNTIVDSTFQNLKLAKGKVNVLEENGLDKGNFFLLTCHREENVDNKKRLANILEGMIRVTGETGIPIVFPAHPRTQKRLEEFGLIEKISPVPSIRLIKPLGYFEFLILMKNAAVVLTDSGGVQEECCILSTPCVTLRDNTERVETVTVGCNIIAGTDPDKVWNGVSRMINIQRDWKNPFGDGLAAVRIVNVVESALENGANITDISHTPRYQMKETMIMEEVSCK
jgi:UDP-N-acetylglucosamine 2-epimerase (non-hydrolysing)